VHRRRRWIFPILLLGGFAAFAGLWYAGADESPNSEPAYGGTYTEGMAGAPSRVNPLFAGQNAVDETLSALVFAGLTRLDDKGQPLPDLAEAWTLSPDGLAYTFVLRPTLLWQDGTPLTTDDVVFTYELLRSPDLRAAPGLTGPLQDVRVVQVDARTLRVELTRPFAPLPAYLTVGILPRHILGSSSAASLIDDLFNQRPVGAGPYRIAELSAERAVLEANPGYHLGQPYIQRLELNFYRDEGALLAALKAGQIQGAVFTGGIRPAERQRLELRGDLRLSLLPANEVTFVYLNLNRTQFEDRRVRQALFHAIDRQALNESIFGGQVQLAVSPLPAGSWAARSTLERFDSNPETAARLLDAAGWLLNARNVRARGGRDLAFELLVNNDPVKVAVATAVADAWGKLGVPVTVSTLGATALVRDRLEPRSFDAVLFSQISPADPDPYAFWHSSQRGLRAANLSTFADARVDQILDEARSQASQIRRGELYTEFQEIFAEEMPAIPLYASTELYVQPTNLHGVRLSSLANPGSRFWQVQEWHLKTQ
jgi:peptide/nickel transport system substrate-binding protein